MEFLVVALIFVLALGISLVAARAVLEALFTLMQRSAVQRSEIPNGTEIWPQSIEATPQP
jgi:hypothetical protein